MMSLFAACTACLAANGVTRKPAMKAARQAPMDAAANADRTLRARRVTTNQRTIRKARRRAFAAGYRNAFTPTH